MIMGLLLSISLLHDICPPSFDPDVPVPIIVTITGQDADTGEPLYERPAYVFLGPISPLPGVTVEDGWTCAGAVSVYRVMKPAGQRCNPVAHRIIEVSYQPLSYCREADCYPPPNEVKR